MLRSINHFSLHRINSTELRVVSDVAEGVLPVIQAEESVVRKYTQRTGWPHRWITLFVLEDLQPLLRQLRQGARPASLAFAPSENRDYHAPCWNRDYDARQNLSTADIAALSERPVVNVYDLADLSTCNIFVNRREMMTQHYWEDAQAMRGLMAHEHAHPLAENEITRASRQIHFQVLDGRVTTPQPPPAPVLFGGAETGTTSPPPAPVLFGGAETGTTSETGNRLSKIPRVLDLLGEKLSLLAPREILTNEMTIQSSFSEDLLHLNLCNMDNAGASIAGRTALAQHLQQEVAQGDLTEQETGLLLLVGDLNGFLPLALEIAPFYRAGKPDEARALEQILETRVFPFLDPLAVKCYMDLRDHSIALSAPSAPSAGNLPLSEMVAWSNTVLQILCQALMVKDYSLQYEMGLSER